MLDVTIFQPSDFESSTNFDDSAVRTVTTDVYAIICGRKIYQNSGFAAFETETFGSSGGTGAVYVAG